MPGILGPNDHAGRQATRILGPIGHGGSSMDPSRGPSEQAARCSGSWGPLGRQQGAVDPGNQWGRDRCRGSQGQLGRGIDAMDPGAQWSWR
jgi:hypothetical protein